MVSEDVETILAFIVLIFLFLSLPFLIILISIASFYELRYILRFIYWYSITDLFMALVLLVILIILLSLTKKLTLWLRD